ncbi:MAG TPA: 2OG-Fe(II) oxygenase [Abditibacteriaceae bacterium]|jgi:SM-20-related protein
MTKYNSDAAAHFGLFIRNAFFDTQTCEELLSAMHSGEDNLATVYGQSKTGTVDERVRKVVRHTPSPETISFVQQRLLECKGAIEEHFGVSLAECEAPHFLRYRVGDFFVAHQDGNTGMLRSEQESRRISVVIFLSRQADHPENEAYCGGSLVFHDWRAPQGSRELAIAGNVGMLVAFRSETTHEVTPVTHGERLTIACWYR